MLPPRGRAAVAAIQSANAASLARGARLLLHLLRPLLLLLPPWFLCCMGTRPGRSPAQRVKRRRGGGYGPGRRQTLNHPRHERPNDRLLLLRTPSSYLFRGCVVLSLRPQRGGCRCWTTPGSSPACSSWRHGSRPKAVAGRRARHKQAAIEVSESSQASGLHGIPGQQCRERCTAHRRPTREPCARAREPCSCTRTFRRPSCTPESRADR